MVRNDPQGRSVLARDEIELFTYSCRPWSRYIIVPDFPSRRISALISHLISVDSMNHRVVYILKISNPSFVSGKDPFLCKPGYMHQNHCVCEPVVIIDL